MTRMTKDLATPYGVLNSDITELVRETRPELLCPQRLSACTYGRIATTLAALIGAAITLLASAHAFAAPVDQVQRLVQEHHACAVVLGLDASEAPYQHCIASLDHALAQLGPQAAGLDPNPQTTRQKAIAACADVGQDRNSGCVADLDQTLSDEQQIYR